MIVDNGSNIVIRLNNFPSFEQNLSSFQREKHKMYDMEEKFKYGPIVTIPWVTITTRSRNLTTFYYKCDS